MEDRPTSGAGWLATLVLAIALILIFQFSGKLNVPTVFSAFSERTELAVVECLETSEGKKLFGDIKKVSRKSVRPVDQRDGLYLSSKGHLILFQQKFGETTLWIKDFNLLTDEQIDFLLGCSDRLAMW